MFPQTGLEKYPPRLVNSLWWGIDISLVLGDNLRVTGTTHYLRADQFFFAGHQEALTNYRSTLVYALGLCFRNSAVLYFKVCMMTMGPQVPASPCPEITLALFPTYPSVCLPSSPSSCTTIHPCTTLCF